MLSTEDLNKVVESPYLQQLFIIGKYFHILPFDEKLLSLTKDQIYVLLKLIELNTPKIEPQNPNAKTEVYEDPDFIKENIDILKQFKTFNPNSNSTPTPLVTDWEDIPFD